MTKSQWRMASSLCVLSLAFWGCASSPKTSNTATASQTYPEVTLVNWSDFHSAVYELEGKDGKASGGIPVFMSAVENARGEGLSLLIDGGDMCQGAMTFNEAKGMGMVELMNTLNIDVATFGNHEFDYGGGVKYPDSPRGALREMVESSHFPWVNANVVSTEKNTIDSWAYDNNPPYVILEKGPYRIAVVGVLTTETPIATTAAHVQGLEFQSPAETLQKIIPEIVEQNPDFLIVNAHVTGLPTTQFEPGEVLYNVTFDQELGEILALPEEILSHVDLILSGHSHKSFIAHQGNLVVVQSKNNGAEITTMKLSGDANGLHLVRDSIHKQKLKHDPIDTGCGQEKKSLEPIDVGGVMLMPSQVGVALVEKYEQRMTQNRCDVMGCFETAFERNKIGECPLGNLVADAMMAAFPEADGAAINSGGIRIDMPAGKIYRETLNSLMPFDNYLHLVRMRGENILKMLKISSSLKHGTTEVAGISYRVEPGCQNPEDLNGDGTIESWENNCLCDDVQIQGKPLIASEFYKLAMSDFILNGGDDHAGCFEGVETLNVGSTIKEALMTYVSQQQKCMAVSDFVDANAPRVVTGSCHGHFAK